jgi:hypothetical protein
MWELKTILNAENDDTFAFALVRDSKRAFVVGDAGDLLELKRAIQQALGGDLNLSAIRADDPAFATCWVSTGQAMRRYGLAKSTARYRAANDPRCRKEGNAWECPAEVWEEYAG